jgi:hypothetical protein
MRVRKKKRVLIGWLNSYKSHTILVTLKRGSAIWPGMLLALILTLSKLLIMATHPG